MTVAHPQTQETAASPEPQGDNELLARIAHGDRDAFAGLYDRLAPNVYGLALRVVRSPALAEEVSQDVFLTVWLKGASFDPARGSARTWILTITHRRAVDAVRREEANRDRSARSAFLEEQSDTDVVSEAVLSRASTRQAEEQISTALGSLTALQRAAIELAYFDGLTCVQVAERLQVPVPTAKSRIRDGLRRLATTVPRQGVPQLA